MAISHNLRWHKSPACAEVACVEVAFDQRDGVFVRDSKAPDGAVLEFDSAEWSAFVSGVRSGEFDGN